MKKQVKSCIGNEGSDLSAGNYAAAFQLYAADCDQMTYKGQG